MCWHTRCIAGDCDGTHHLDYTGATWTEERPVPYDPDDPLSVEPETMPREVVGHDGE